MEIPQLSEKEKEECLLKAKESPRHRYAKILHKPGAEWNQVFNFLLPDSYMQPHLHPNKEKVEDIYVREGKLGVLFFDDQGDITRSMILENGGQEMIKIPAFAWHTYVTLSDFVVTYETMSGVYDPATWKTFAAWAPAENTPEAREYLNFLKTVKREWRIV